MDLITPVVDEGQLLFDPTLTYLYVVTNRFSAWASNTSFSISVVDVRSLSITSAKLSVSKGYYWTATEKGLVSWSDKPIFYSVSPQTGVVTDSFTTDTAIAHR